MTALYALPPWFLNFCVSALVLLTLRTPASRATETYETGGKWQLLLNSSGVVAMHTAVTHRNTVVMFDQTGAGPSGYRLRRGPHHGRRRRCTSDPRCWAHSVEYDVASNSIRPLVFQTDTWCSSGSFLGNGTLVQTGGYGEGLRKVRYFQPCGDRTCDWWESNKPLGDSRWYASDQNLPEEDSVIVVGGLDAYTYEFVPKMDAAAATFELPFLRETHRRREHGGNLYPFLHLSSDGNLFVFANRDSILLDYRRNRVVKRFPRIPRQGPRNYPATGSSVMLPLYHSDEFKRVEIMVCGGGAVGAFRAARGRNFLRALSSCGRMVITDDDPKWAMEDMPGPRIMNDMLTLPTGDILIVNGATHGSAGWGHARNPSYSPYLYNPKNRPGERFRVLNPSTIPRMYHSSAVLLPDGRVLVAGSNPNRRYAFSAVRFPTELRVEAFVPHYMSDVYDDRRPTNVTVDPVASGRLPGVLRYGEEFVVRFGLGGSQTVDGGVEFGVYAPPFATHSTSMNQRLLRLKCTAVEGGGGELRATVVAPPSPVAAPSGYYMLTIVNEGTPSKATWLKLVHA